MSTMKNIENYPAEMVNEFKNYLGKVKSCIVHSNSHLQIMDNPFYCGRLISDISGRFRLAVCKDCEKENDPKGYVPEDNWVGDDENYIELCFDLRPNGKVEVTMWSVKNENIFSSTRLANVEMYDPWNEFIDTEILPRVNKIAYFTWEECIRPCWVRVSETM